MKLCQLPQVPPSSSLISLVPPQVVPATLSIWVEFVIYRKLPALVKSDKKLELFSKFIELTSETPAKGLSVIIILNVLSVVLEFAVALKSKVSVVSDETDVAVPDEITAYRKAVRDAYAKIKTRINGVAELSIFIGKLMN